MTTEAYRNRDRSKCYDCRRPNTDGKSRCPECRAIITRKERARYEAKKTEILPARKRRYHGDAAYRARALSCGGQRHIEWSRANKDKTRCHTAVQMAIKSGAITRPCACSACGVACKPDGHHADYSKPLEIQWLCRSCHGFANYAKNRMESEPSSEEVMPKCPSS